MPEIRAFIAVPLPEDLRKSVQHLQKRLAENLPDVRWVKLGQVHLTLRFFPALPEEELDQIHEIMLSVGNFCSPFSVEISGFGAFPHISRPRVFWLGLKPAAPLIHLHRQLDEKLQAAVYEGEGRSFKPHLTIGRPKKTAPSSGRVPPHVLTWSGGQW